MSIHTVYQNAWRSNRDASVSLTFPDDWQVSFLSMPADRLPPLSDGQLRDALSAPLGMPALEALARQGQEAVIVFDDLSRATPTWRIVPLVLQALEAGGISPSHIRFLCATGTHGPLSRVDLVKKLGEEIVSCYPVYNHNPFDCCVSLGKNSRGEEVLINGEFAACDVRVGIGLVSPHPMNGFGGGGKLLFPGLAHMDTTRHNHSRREFTVPGDLEPCGLRRDIEEMTAMAGTFFSIDAVLNAHLDVVGLVAGDPIQAYYAAAHLSAQVNALPPCQPQDVVVVNANAKYNESLIAIKIGKQILKPGGRLILVNHCESGSVIHYLCGTFGSHQGGPCWIPPTGQTLPGGHPVIHFTPYPSGNSGPWAVVYARTWEEALAHLSGLGAGTRCAVISDGSISYFPQEGAIPCLRSS